MRSQRVTLLTIITGVVLAGSLLLVSRGSCARAPSHNPIVSKDASKVRPQSKAPIQVRVTKLIPQPGRVEYHYTVTNGSAFPVHMLTIGFDQLYGVPRLLGEPIGWDGEIVPAASYRAPPGWAFVVEPTEEESLFVVRWEKTQQGRAVMGGESAGGFAVALSQPDPNYDYPDGLWKAYLLGEEPVDGQLLASGVTGVPVSSMLAQSDLKISPHPAGGQVSIGFAMPSTGRATVDIYDVSGRQVRRIMDEQRPSGSASTTWDGRDDAGKPAASGVYFIHVKTPSTQRFGRFTWMPAGK
jgi:hypothetical protein